MSSITPSFREVESQNHCIYQVSSTPIGEGDFSIVYLAKRVDEIASGNERSFAFKVLPMLPDPKYQKRLNREISIVSSITPHPNVMGFEESFRFPLKAINPDIDDSGDATALVTEFVPGKQLFELIVSMRLLSIDTSMKIFTQLVMGLKHCHDQDIAHRDLKPENICIDYIQVSPKREPIIKSVKLIDFGLATEISRDDSGKANPSRTSCGSPHYAAPEIVLCQKYDPKKSDVWSLGVILFVMASGHLPFHHENESILHDLIVKGLYPLPSSIKKDPELVRFIAAMMTVDPQKRVLLDQILEDPFFQKYGKPIQLSSSEKEEKQPSTSTV